MYSKFYILQQNYSFHLPICCNLNKHIVVNATRRHWRTIAKRARILSLDRRRADGRQCFVGLKPYIVANRASAFPSALLTIREGEENRIALQMEKLSNYPGDNFGRKGGGRKGRKKRERFWMTFLRSRSLNWSRPKRENWILRASDRYSICTKRSTANGHVRRRSRVSAGLTGEKSVLTSVISSRYIDLARFPDFSTSLTAIRSTCRRDPIFKKSKATRPRSAWISHWRMPFSRVAGNDSVL